MSKKNIEGKEEEAAEIRDYAAELKGVTSVYIKTRALPNIPYEFAQALSELIHEAAPNSITLDKDYMKAIIQKNKTPSPKTLEKWFNATYKEFGIWNFGQSGNQNYRISLKND